MWELDHKGRALKNWCFWTVVLEKTVESPLDSKEFQPVILRVQDGKIKTSTYIYFKPENKKEIKIWKFNLSTLYSSWLTCSLSVVYIPHFGDEERGPRDLDSWEPTVWIASHQMRAQMSPLQRYLPLEFPSLCHKHSPTHHCHHSFYPS